MIYLMYESIDETFPARNLLESIWIILQRIEFLLDMKLIIKKRLKNLIR